MADWISTGSQLPGGDALVWSGGRHAVASQVTRPDGTIFFMEVHSDCVLEWPTHWMPLPPQPADEVAEPEHRKAAIS